jgi:hypothetical protein
MTHGREQGLECAWPSTLKMAAPMGFVRLRHALETNLNAKTNDSYYISLDKLKTMKCTYSMVTQVTKSHHTIPLFLDNKNATYH